MENIPKAVLKTFNNYIVGKNAYLTIYILDNLQQDVLIKWNIKEKYKPFNFREMNKGMLSLIFTTAEENKKNYLMCSRKENVNQIFSIL